VPARPDIDDAGLPRFHVDCVVTIKRIYVVFVLEVAYRSVHLVGATTTPMADGPPSKFAASWISVIASPGSGFLFRDWVGQFTASFDAVFADVRIHAVRFLRAARGRTVSPNDLFAPSEPNSPTGMLIFGQPALASGVRGVRSP
jgi:hypothetical protein